ncbi:MAG TPA: hypothetical protein VLA59_00620 [Patescibacteria group bacterium]|nr:hypothetical protein [Patescibacteria group bacterium]
MILGLLLAAPTAAEQPARPFSGYSDGYVTFVDNSTDPITLEPCQYPVYATGTFGYASGTASHLGRFDWASVHCAPAADEVITGRLTLTAANGDELVLEYSGPTSAELGSNYFWGTYDFIAIGGDGRFEDATGSGVMTVYTTFESFVDPVWPAEWWLEGSIDY